VEGKPHVQLAGVVIPTQRDRIAAANSILKWDTAMLFVEAQLNMIESPQTIEKKRTRAVMLVDEISETRHLNPALKHPRAARRSARRQQMQNQPAQTTP